MKRLIPVIAVVVAALVVLMVGKNVLAKTIVVGGVRAITGLKLSIDDLDVGLLDTTVRVNGLKLYNPAGFPEPVMIDLPELYVDYDPTALLKGAVHLEEVRLNLREFVVIRNAQGALNLDALKPVQQTKAATGEPAKTAPPKATNDQQGPRVRVDALELSVGKVIYKDYTGGGKPKVQEFLINIKEHYKGINNPYALGSLIVSRALMQTAVARLANVDVAGMQAAAQSQLNQALNQIKNPSMLTGAAKSTATGVADTGAEAVDAAAGALKKLLGNNQR